MKVDVLIAAPDNDVHAHAVRLWTQKLGFSCIVNDLSWDNDGESLHTKLSLDATTSCINWGELTIDSSTSVWWRRPKTPIANDTVINTDLRDFVSQEKKHGLHGLLHAVECRFVNDPFHEARANYKPLQLRTASKIGLTIPETFVTNSFPEAESFCKKLEAEGKSCVFKGFTPSRYHIAETRTVVLSDLRESAFNLSLAPVIFQEFIDKQMDLRAFAVGNQVFWVECYTAHQNLVDWRLDPLVEYRPLNLDLLGLNQLVLKLLAELGLDTGSFDFRLTPNGKPVFFEVNPAGQFLFMETDADLPVSKAMAELLLAHKLRVH